MPDKVDSDFDVLGLINRLYLFAFCCGLGALTLIVYLNYGVGFGTITMGVLTVLAFLGATTSATKVRSIITWIFSSSP